MKKLVNVFVQVLALNFLLLAGAVGWLYQGGHLDRAKVAAVKGVLFPEPEPPASPAPAAPPAPKAAAPTTRPLPRLDALLEKHAGKPSGEIAEAVRHDLETQLAVLDRRRREVEDLQAQVAAEQQKVAEASATLEAQRRQTAEREQQAAQAASDKGFDESLKLYSAMQGKQVKASFMSMPDEAVVRLLEAMPPRTATRIIKEFKTPQEQARINRVLDKLGRGVSQPATRPADGERPGLATADPADPAAAPAP